MLDESQINEISKSDLIACLGADISRLCRYSLYTEMNSERDLHRPIILDFQAFHSKNPAILQELLSFPSLFLPLLDSALSCSQQIIISQQLENENLILKQNLHVRLDCYASTPMEIHTIKVPRAKSVGELIAFKGTVIRTGQTKLLECKKIYECNKCKDHVVVEYDRSLYNQIPKPLYCGAKGLEDDKVCESNKFTLVHTEAGDLPNSFCDYQEVKVQEQIGKLQIGTVSTNII